MERNCSVTVDKYNIMGFSDGGVTFEEVHIAPQQEMAFIHLRRADRAAD